MYMGQQICNRHQRKNKVAPTLP